MIMKFVINLWKNIKESKMEIYKNKESVDRLLINIRMQMEIKKIIKKLKKSIKEILQIVIIFMKKKNNKVNVV
jgi:hypothetical protein